MHKRETYFIDWWAMRDNTDLRLIQGYLTEGFELELFYAAVYNLSDVNNALRFSNYAYAFRELFHHVLKRLAPDDSVEGCTWFAGRNEQNKVPRKDSYKYIIQGGLADEYVINELGVDNNEIFLGLRDAFTSLNRLTHISEAVFPVNSDRGLEIVTQVEGYIAGLFRHLDDCHSRIIHLLSQKVGHATIESSVSDTIESIDLLSTHSSLDAVYIEHIKIIEINHAEIIFKASGSVDIGLQWGSNSDIRNDLGAVGEKSFPFSCEVRSPVDDPENTSCDEEAFIVDTRSWFEDYYE
ncbi:hypothetical protein QRZ28_20465 [Raoultella ornithinolytica]|uniref:pPIWI-associating nuclease domain-containing protein n=1 Tax=Raoultella ornithinolytica TaxID=54291 RepID=UPI00255AA936|nr:hypothetical protein [Raoultella ornithinolytica]MDL4584235.1 hypothetical protein [Raoultella ornithinolytica]